MSEYERLAALLTMARIEIGTLQREAAALPPDIAADFLVALDRLAEEARRLAHRAARSLRDH
jgi:hypothetical protein